MKKLIKIFNKKILFIGMMSTFFTEAISTMVKNNHHKKINSKKKYLKPILLISFNTLLYKEYKQHSTIPLKKVELVDNQNSLILSKENKDFEGFEDFSRINSSISLKKVELVDNQNSLILSKENKDFEDFPRINSTIPLKKVELVDNQNSLILSKENKDFEDFQGIISQINETTKIIRREYSILTKNYHLNGTHLNNYINNKASESFHFCNDGQCQYSEKFCKNLTWVRGKYSYINLLKQIKENKNISELNLHINPNETQEISLVQEAIKKIRQNKILMEKIKSIDFLQLQSLLKNLQNSTLRDLVSFNKEQRDNPINLTKTIQDHQNKICKLSNLLNVNYSLIFGFRFEIIDYAQLNINESFYAISNSNFFNDDRSRDATCAMKFSINSQTNTVTFYSLNNNFAHQNRTDYSRRTPLQCNIDYSLHDEILGASLQKNKKKEVQEQYRKMFAETKLNTAIQLNQLPKEMERLIVYILKIVQYDYFVS